MNAILGDAQIIDTILEWCGRVFAIVGIVFLFIEAIGCLRKRSNTKLTILGLVFLSVAVIGYLLTELILRDENLPVVFSLLWIVFLWAYLICNLISAVSISKKARAAKKAKLQEAAATVSEETVSEDNAEQPTETIEEETVTVKQKGKRKKKDTDGEQQ